MIFHSGVNAPNSIQDYFGASGWHSFFFSAADLGLTLPVSFEELTEEFLKFNPHDVDALINNCRAVSLLTSSVVNGNLVYNHASSLIPMRKMGPDVSNPRYGNDPLYQGRILNVWSTGDRTQFTFAEKCALLGRQSTYVTFAQTALGHKIELDCSAQKINFIDMDFGSVVPNFNIKTVANGVELEHVVTKVANNRFMFNNTRTDVTKVIIEFTAGQPAFDLKSIKIMTDNINGHSAVSINFALLRPVSVTGSLLPVGADYPFMVISSGGTNATTEMRLDIGTKQSGEDVVVMHCQIRPQVVEI
jgi:hypothetical protein